MRHIPVLLHEAIEGLDIKEGDIIVDSTLGSGGHSEAIAGITPDVKIIAIDIDEKAIERCKANLSAYKNITYVNDNFRNIDSILSDLQIDKADKFLFDLGFSSEQLVGRGMSFIHDEPLYMALSLNHKGFSAEDIVNKWDEENIRHIIRGFGEERFAGRIARAIVKERENKEIKTTKELASIVERAIPRRGFSKIHPATRTFQALRIAVNDELGALQEGLEGAFNRLNIGGRIAVISFHSLEDRIVKYTFRAWKQAQIVNVITKKPITSTDSEIETNPRSRSAKLRIIERIK